MPKPDVTQSNAFPFTDVTPPDWFYDDVKWAYEEEIMTGETSTRFAPANAISQATVVHQCCDLGKADWYAARLQYLYGYRPLLPRTDGSYAGEVSA